MRNCHLLMTVLVVLAAVSVGASAQYATYDLYWADLDSDDIWAYPDTVGTVISPSASFSSITSLAVTQSGDLLVGMMFDGIKRLDVGAATVDIVDPYAYNVGELCEDGETGDIFWITGSGYYELYVLADGATSSELVYSFGRQPVDIDVIPYGAHAGNLLVLLDPYSADPELVEMERTGQFEFSAIDTIVIDGHGYPRAFSFMQDGTVVVLDLLDGMVLFDLDDGYIGQLAPVPASDPADISVGADGTIYVFDQNYGYGCVLRFDQLGNQVLPQLSGPVIGGAIEATSYTPTPPGSNVPVNPMQNVELLFEEITDGGYTSASAFESSSRTSPGGNTLPAFADPPAGRSDFTYIDATTSAVYEDLIQVDIYLPGSRFFVAQGTGGEFHDVTVVGSIEDARGVISRFDSPVQAPGGSRLIEGPTEFVLGEDTRPVADAVDAKFSRLIDILTGAENSPSNTWDLVYARRYLLRRALRAQTLHEAANSLGAVAELAMMNDDIRVFAMKVIPNSSEDELGNVAGEMLSRSKTLMFSLGLMISPAHGERSTAASDRLALAAPNPVYGECRMQLAGPAGAQAVAAIYTVNGRLVTTLFDGELEGGSHELIWDGTDDSGRKVASGVYLTRAIAGAEVATGKLVLIR